MLSIVKYILESRGKKRKTEEEKKEYIQGIGILDQISHAKEENKENMIDSFVSDFVKPNGPTIYAFITDKVKDVVKVGYTDQHPEKRIAQWKDIYGKEAGEVTCIGYWSSEEFNEVGERVFFWDHAIHKKLRDKRYKQLKKNEFMANLTEEGKKIANIHFSREFFNKYKHLFNNPDEFDPEDKEELSAELLKDLILQMKANIKAGKADFKLYSFDQEGKTSSKEANKIWGSPDTYSNTELQEEAIKNGIKAIKEDKKNILMAAVMRFGKTHATYEIIKGADLKKVIVCSAKADVRKAWRDDINHVHFYKDFVFIEVKDEYNWNITHYKDDKLVTEHLNIYKDSLDNYKDKTQIFFFTLHDLGGSVHKMKEKHKGLFNDEFDLMVVDETHYGSHASTFGQATGLGRKEIEDDEDEENGVDDEQQINKETQNALNKLNIKYKSILQVSGTPYYILASNEMIKDDAEIISKVSYSDMLKERDKWIKENPEEDQSKSPYFGIPTLHKIGLKLTKECLDALKDKNVSDSLSSLFETKGNKFKYEKPIESLMKSVFGDGTGQSLSFLSNKKVDGNKVCKHTIIVLPRKKACWAMKDLLSKFINTNERQIFCIVDTEGHKPDVESVDDLNDKLYDLDNKGKKSIILTVNRYLTGVSMPCVDSMIYLKNASSPQEYDQNIFRLCTRYVKKVKNPDDESRSEKVNMKENVYLIDFNIANMLKMINNSARMKAAADGDPTIDNIKKYMEEDLKAVPIFAESKASDEILSKMKKLDNKDLMEIYTGYNKNKSIADIVNDEIDIFAKLFTDKEYKDFQNFMIDLNIEGDKSKMNLDINDEGDENVDAEGNDGGKKKHNSLPKYIDKNDDKKRAQLSKEKFKAITKNLLYCNICLDEPCIDMKHIMDKADKDDEFKNMLIEFKININDLKKAYDMMGAKFKESYDSLICRMSQLANDKSMNSYEAFSKAIQGLGRLDKNEVVTPPEIVEKMINKLDKSDYEKANSILLVNEKQAEFFMGLHKKFNGKYDNKCKIVASSEIGKHLCRKMLKSVGIKDYIKLIINIDDVDGNGHHDVNDFLKMKNEDILKENNGKKFDIVLMNPPYGDRGGTIHLRFVDKCMNISKKQIVVMPFGFVNKDNKAYNEYKNKLSKYLESVDEESFTSFDASATIKSVGIYKLDINHEGDIKIKYINGNEKLLDHLMNYSNFSDYEKNITEILYKHSRIPLIWAGSHDHVTKKSLNKKGIYDENEINKLIKQNVSDNCNQLRKYIDEHKNNVYITLNNHTGLGAAKFIAAEGGKIFLDGKKLIDYLLDICKTSGYIITSFKTEKEINNFKIAIQNPLLRFVLLRIQKDHNMVPKYFNHIPGDIDWSDDRVKTDEGLLEVCGCPKDKCKEYAEYCKKIIEQVDKK